MALSVLRFVVKVCSLCYVSIVSPHSIWLLRFLPNERSDQGIVARSCRCRIVEFWCDICNCSVALELHFSTLKGLRRKI